MRFSLAVRFTLFTVVAGLVIAAFCGNAQARTISVLVDWLPLSTSVEGVSHYTPHPKKVAVGIDGSVVFSSGDRVWLFREGTLRMVAGGDSVDPERPHVQLNLRWPNGVAVGVDGSVVIADTGNDRVLLVKDGEATWIAGTGLDLKNRQKPPNPDRPADDATNTQLNDPAGVAVGVDGSIVIADTENNRVLRVEKGKIKKIAGADQVDPTLPPDDATNTSLRWPCAVAVGVDGSVVIADTGNHRVLSVKDGKVTVIAGTGPARNGRAKAPDPSRQADEATNTQLIQPTSVAVGVDGSVVVEDSYNYRVVSVKDGKVTVIAGTGRNADGYPNARDPNLRDVATNTQLIKPIGVAVGVDGSVVIAEKGGWVCHVAPDDKHQQKLDQLLDRGIAAIDRESWDELRSVNHELAYFAGPVEKNAQALSRQRFFISEVFDRLPQEIRREILNKAEAPGDQLMRLRAFLTFLKLRQELADTTLQQKMLRVRYRLDRWFWGPDISNNDPTFRQLRASYWSVHR